MLQKKRITFVLPGRNRSGGVRVTVVMANELRKLGYDTRILYRTNRLVAIKHIKFNLKRLIYGIQRIDWLWQYEGSVERFTDIRKKRFLPGEIVIAVGLYTIQDVRKLDDSVFKMRYNHGFSVGVDELTNSCWGGSMPTIAVASTLVSRIEKLSKEKVIGVVPNGIDPTEYFVENDIARNGIGVMYSSHPNKCPQDVLRIMEGVRDTWPDIPRYYFGGDRRPHRLNGENYTRYPSVKQTRDIYNKCLIWLSASCEEGFCLPILEAMACGCAVVSADNLGVRELIRDGENGFIVSVGDIDAFLSKIKKLLENVKLRESFVKKGLNTAKSFSWEQAGQRMHNCLQTVEREYPHICF